VAALAACPALDHRRSFSEKWRVIRPERDPSDTSHIGTSWARRRIHFGAMRVIRPDDCVIKFEGVISHNAGQHHTIR
jgi:hypothetical protein